MAVCTLSISHMHNTELISSCLMAQDDMPALALPCWVQGFGGTLMEELRAEAQDVSDIITAAQQYLVSKAMSAKEAVQQYSDACVHATRRVCTHANIILMFTSTFTSIM